jgi:hypothetical protein
MKIKLRFSQSQTMATEILHNAASEYGGVLDESMPYTTASMKIRTQLLFSSRNIAIIISVE